MQKHSIVSQDLVNYKNETFSFKAVEWAIDLQVNEWRRLEGRGQKIQINSVLLSSPPSKPCLKRRLFLSLHLRTASESGEEANN